MVHIGILMKYLMHVCGGSFPLETWKKNTKGPIFDSKCSPTFSGLDCHILYDVSCIH